MMTNNDKEAGTPRDCETENVNSRGAAVWEHQEHDLCKKKNKKKKCLLAIKLILWINLLNEQERM